MNALDFGAAVGLAVVLGLLALGLAAWQWRARFRRPPDLPDLDRRHFLRQDGRRFLVAAILAILAGLVIYGAGLNPRADAWTGMIFIRVWVGVLGLTLVLVLLALTDWMSNARYGRRHLRHLESERARLLAESRRLGGKPPSPAGFTLVEVVLVIGVVVVFLLLLMATMPGQRERARALGCQNNLRQIGLALALYHQSAGHLPQVPALVADEPSTGPLTALLTQIQPTDDPRLNAATWGRLARGEAPEEKPIPGFVCASDRNATAAIHPAPVSYRAVTGDAPDGRNGPFALGKRTTLDEVQAGDGVGYTAGFVERLTGDGAAPPIAVPKVFHYARVAGTVGAEGCVGPIVPAEVRGDAGRSWLPADWRSTLANFMNSPDAPRSCIAEDGRTAAMGASSGHAGRVHVLILDGSVRSYGATVAPAVWRALATVGNPTSKSEGPAAATSLP